jgi:hypothetical protein
MNDPHLTPEEAALLRALDREGPPPADLPPDFSAHQQEHAALGELLRRTAAPELPYPDFFNAQLQRRIREEQVPAPAAPPARVSWFERIFRSPWALAGAAAVLAAVAWMGWDNGGARGGNQVISLFSPESRTAPEVFFSEEAEATVILLDSVEAYPADRAIVASVPAVGNVLVAAGRTW